MKFSRLFPIVLVLVGLGVYYAYPTLSGHLTERATAQARGESSEQPRAPTPVPATREAGDVAGPADAETALLRTALQQLRSAADARADEALLTFKDAEAYQRFLSRAQHRGLAVLGQLDPLLAVRIRYDELGALEAELREFGATYSRIAPNYLVHVPSVPAKVARATSAPAPFRNTTLAYLGAEADRSTWGRGVTIAILDTGVAPDATFDSSRLRYLNVDLGTLPGRGEEDGHGTSVAALAAGAATDAAGVAPAATILSIRVTDAAGTSDLFTVARALVAATDAGAAILNVSLGGYATTPTLAAAIDYARSHGAVIVAAAGNDQAAQLAWPAADPRVISVGAVDATSRQVAFSNSGADLQIVAPGYGVQTAWLDTQRVYVNGTSAATPLVAGAIAAVMSQNPGYTADHAWQVIRQTVSDAGAPGADADYGAGILNLDWALHAADYARADPAVATHYYDATRREVDVVIQNRSARAVSGLGLDVDTSGSLKTYPLPTIQAGASYVVAVPVDLTALAANGQLAYATQLVIPFGLEDANVANNRLASVLPAAAIR